MLDSSTLWVSMRDDVWIKISDIEKYKAIKEAGKLPDMLTKAINDYQLEDEQPKPDRWNHADPERQNT